MGELISVIIIGVPVACEDGLKESWRNLADWAASQLHARFGERVRVQYYDLFDPKCPTLPPDSQLPAVFVDGVLISSGGKISIPLICKRIEEILTNQNIAV